VRGTHPALRIDLRAWCRAQGHGYDEDVGGAPPGTVAWVARGRAVAARLSSSELAAGTAEDAGVHRRPPARWGLAPRGARVELGGPEPFFPLDRREVVWADEAPKLYAQAAANQWDPASAIDWQAPICHDAHVEQAVVQVMTYLVENETAALVVPARFLGAIHPHFREVVQLLAVQVADEARHIEVFTRRALLGGHELGLSTAGGRQSLQTLLDEPDFAVAAFLLSVLGEGTFLSLLSFLEQHAPDPVTRRVAQLALADEARHVAFGMGHLRGHVEVAPSLRSRLVTAVERRHDALAQTSGLNDEVFDALVLLAAGSLDPAAVARGWVAVQALQADMDTGRRRRLTRLGFTASEAETLSALHTRNFM
jgi:hypothetical protein